MRAGYKIENHTGKDTAYIIVANYSGNLNLVATYSFPSENSPFSEKDENDIGFWRIKRKETIKAK